MERPAPATMGYSDFITEIDKGEIKIPQFQREFVWSKSQSAKLLDSILKGFPIGAFIFWKTKERLRVIRNIGGASLPEADEGDKVTYVLDGQQRMTSIYASVKGIIVERSNGGVEDFSKIYVSLDADIESGEPVVVDDDAGLVEGSYFELRTLLSGDILTEIPSFDTKYHQKIQDYFKALQSYQFPTVTLKDVSLDVATEVFTRLNIGGKSLTTFEIMCAKTYNEKRDFDLLSKVECLYESWSKAEYESISNMSILQSVSACINKECRSKEILNTPRDTFIDAWDDVTKAFNSAIDYFRSNYKITASKLLPYDGLLVPFTYYLYNHPERPPKDHADKLRDFFWRVVLSNRYSSALETHIAQDLRYMDSILNEENEPYDVNVDISSKRLTDEGGFVVSRAFTKGLLCILAEQGPVSFNDSHHAVRIDNSWLSRANSMNYHHFFPKDFLRKSGTTEDWKANHVANITIVDDHLNKNAIRAKAPSVYMTQFSKDNPEFKLTMKTHLIDPDTFGVYEDDYEKFFSKRIKEYQKKLKKKLIWREEFDRS